MKLLKKYFLVKIDKFQVKQTNDRCCVRLSSSISIENSNNHHYFFYTDSSLLLKIKNIVERIEAAKIYVSSYDEIAKSKGKLFKYNVSELYLDNGKIISV